MQLNLADLVDLTQLSDEDAERFHQLRHTALETAKLIFDDRAQSYNVNHEPYREMPFGVVSLISELFKRVIRLTSLVSPKRGETPFREEDLARLEDTFIDAINYASWGYAMLCIAREHEGKTYVATRTYEGHTGEVIIKEVLDNGETRTAEAAH